MPTNTGAATTRMDLTLPVSDFTSSETFEIDRQRLFNRKWICIGRQEEIARPGDYVVRDLLGATGFALTKIAKTGGMFDLIEAKPVRT